MQQGSPSLSPFRLLHLGEDGVATTAEDAKHIVLLHNRGASAPGYFENPTTMAVYNHLGGPKEYRVYPSQPHNLHPEWEPDSPVWLRRQLGLP